MRGRFKKATEGRERDYKMTGIGKRRTESEQKRAKKASEARTRAKRAKKEQKAESRG
jgi:hypothetical protein